jgi:hypothetical protein
MTRKHDAPDRPKAKQIIGALPPGAIPILDEHGVRRGHVSGHKASAVTVARFGVHHARLRKISGKPVWIGEGAASINNRRHAELKLQQQRAIAKGSVTTTPTKPALARRPERGG